MPTSTATQSPEGRWLLKVRHDIDRPTLKIPVVLVYDGHSAIDDDDTPITVTNTYPANPVITQWKTPLGQAIDTSKITIKKPYPQVIDGYNIYEVTGITWEKVEPYTAETYELRLEPTPPEIAWNGESQITAFYRKTVDMSAITDTNVTVDTVFTIKNDDGSASIVNVGDKRYLRANSGKTSAITDTKEVTIAGVYANEIEGETVVKILAKSDSDVPEDPEEGGGGGGTSGDTPTVSPEPIGITDWGGTGVINAVNDDMTWNVKVLPNDLTKTQKIPVIKIQDESLGLDYIMSWKSQNGGYYAVTFRTSDASNRTTKTGTTIVSAVTKDGKYFTTTTIKIVEAGIYITSVSPTGVTIPKTSTVYSGDSFTVNANFRFEIGSKSKNFFKDISAITESMLDTTVEVYPAGTTYFARRKWFSEYTGGRTSPLWEADSEGKPLTSTSITSVTTNSEGTITGGTIRYVLAVKDNLGAERSYNVRIRGVGNGDTGKTIKVTQKGTSSFVDEVDVSSGYCESSGEFRWRDPSRPNEWMEISPYTDANNRILGYFNVTCEPSELSTVKRNTRVSQNWLTIEAWEQTGKSGKPEGSKQYRVLIKAAENTSGSRRSATITFNNNALSRDAPVVKKTVYITQGA